jgi:hypothetical protein
LAASARTDKPPRRESRLTCSNNLDGRHQNPQAHVHRDHPMSIDRGRRGATRGCRCAYGPGCRPLPGHGLLMLPWPWSRVSMRQAGCSSAGSFVICRVPIRPLSARRVRDQRITGNAVR